MTNYLTRVTVSPVNIKLNLNSQPPQPAKVTLFNWCYRFRDGSRLVGQLKGQLDKDNKTLLHPTEIRADYLSQDGKRVLQSWQGQDFAAFETTIPGNEPLIVASNDNFVDNSLCLINSSCRTRAQITVEGTQVIGEPFTPEAWSLIPQPSPATVPESRVTLDWAFSPSFPFVCVNVNVGLPRTQTRYTCTFSPYLPFYPFIMVGRTRAS